MEIKRLDRRIERTRHLLQDALIALILEKGYEAVTVQDVIDRANVGRSTFYTHFYDLDDLLHSEFDQLWSQFEAYLGTRSIQKGALWDISLMMFQHAQTYQPVYKAVIGKQSGQIMQLHIHKSLASLFRANLKSQGLDKKNEIVAADVLVHYLVSSLTALMSWWLDNNLPYTAERMHEMYQHLARPGIEAIWTHNST